MYRLAPGPQPLPGTQLVQRVDGDGLGAYTPTPSYWGSPAALAGVRGLGCAKDCGCGGRCSGGMGFFDSGLDPSGWGAPEWAAVAFGGYMLFSTLFTTIHGARSAREGVRQSVKRTRRRIGKRIAGSR